MNWETIESITHAYQAGTYTPSDLVAFYLNAIEKRNPDLHAFLDVWQEDARMQAAVSTERIEKKTARPLEGIPIALKDNLCVKGKRTTAGSRILSDYTATYTATAVQKLEDAGAVLLGKTNLDEFAMGSSTEHSAFGPTKNPHDTSRVPGGSSGGSAAAVAADLCAAAIGSDTGGSIRQPASFCGVVGFKPTYGRISRYGLIAMSSSLDQIGPFARSVRGTTLLYDVLQGVDPKDATTVAHKDISTESHDLRGKRFCVPAAYEKYELDPYVKELFTAACEAVKDAGASIETIDIPHIDSSLPVYYLLVTSEISSNLARYDGIRYGSSSEAENLVEQYIATRSDGFGEEAKRRIMLGTFTLSAGYRDKYYKQAAAVRQLISLEMKNALSGYDALLSPTSPTAAFALGERFADPLTMYLSDLFTVPANIANLPAISLPTPSTGLPVGIQLIGNQFKDHSLLGIAERVEAVLGRAEPPSTVAVA